MQPNSPARRGMLGAGDVRATGASIAARMEASGAIPWTPGGHTDPWNHVEAAMALLIAGEPEVAERGYAWVRRVQRPDGSMPLRTVANEIEDASGETNMSAYVAVGVWHHWLVRRDAAFVRLMWPTVRRALNWVTSLQLPFGGIAWSQEWRDGRPAAVNREALLAGSSSIHHALLAGVALAALVDEPHPDWQRAGGRLAHALRVHPDRFLDKSTFSMDWYYPVLGGAIRGDAGHALIDARWSEFVVPGLGVRCVDSNPWVTGAETCELALTLDALGRREEASRLLADAQRLRSDDGSYWTGWVYEPEGVHWPDEQTTYTAAAVLLANDALARTTPGSGIIRGTGLGADFVEAELQCGCSPDDARLDTGLDTGLPPHTP